MKLKISCSKAQINNNNNGLSQTTTIFNILYIESTDIKPGIIVTNNIIQIIKLQLTSKANLYKLL